jgi:hypothetical protein
MLGLAALAACGSDAEDQPTADAHVEDRPSTVVDSILPIEEELRRFRAVLGPEPTGLSGGAASRDALVGTFFEALAAADTAALLGLAITVDEFGWLYYPHTMYTAPPYELPPGVVWMLTENGSSRGLGRLLERLAGRPLEFLGYSCAPEPVVEERNLTWAECSVRFRAPGEEPREMRLFGSILERDGVFKFISYANDF